MYYCPFYRCPVAVTINEHQWEVVNCCRDIQLFRVLLNTLISWSACVRMERIWPNAVHHQMHAKQLLVAECQPRCAKSIICGSRYDAKQML